MKSIWQILDISSYTCSYPSFLLKVGNHGDCSDVVEPDHSPEVTKRFGHRTCKMTSVIIRQELQVEIGQRLETRQRAKKEGERERERGSGGGGEKEIDSIGESD